MKIKNFLRNTTLVGLAIGTSLFGITEKAKASFSIKYTNPLPRESKDYYSDNSKLKLNDEVGVFVESNDPNIGKFCIGRFIVQDDNSYGLMHVYRDDDTTPYKDGALDNEVLKFMIWDSQKNKAFPTKTTPTQVNFGQLEWNKVDVEKRGYNLKDLADFADHWLELCNESNNDCDYLGRHNQILNFKDFADFANNWINLK